MAAADRNNHPAAKVLVCASRDGGQFSILLEATTAWTNQRRASDPAKATSTTAAAAEVAQTAALQATETPLILLWLFPVCGLGDKKRYRGKGPLCFSDNGYI